MNSDNDVKAVFGDSELISSFYPIITARGLPLSAVETPNTPLPSGWGRISRKFSVYFALPIDAFTRKLNGSTLNSVESIDLYEKLKMSFDSRDTNRLRVEYVGLNPENIRIAKVQPADRIIVRIDFDTWVTAPSEYLKPACHCLLVEEFEVRLDLSLLGYGELVTYVDTAART